MIRTLALIKRRPDLDRAAFRDHYESTHVALALPLLDGLVHYVRHHVERDLVGEIDFDVLTAFGYRDREAVDRIVALLAGEAGAAVREDELRFMDKPANRFFPVSERLLSGPGPLGERQRSGPGAADERRLSGRGAAGERRLPADGSSASDSDAGGGAAPSPIAAVEEGPEHVFVLLARPSGVSRFEASKVFVRDAWPRLAHALGAPRFACLRDAFPMAGRPPPWDLVLQTSPPDTGQGRLLDAWLRRMEKDGYRVAAVRTRRYETKLPAATAR